MCVPDVDCLGKVIHHTSSVVFQGPSHCQRPMVSSHLTLRVALCTPDPVRGSICTNKSVPLVGLSNGEKKGVGADGPRSINIRMYVCATRILVQYDIVRTAQVYE